MKRGFTIGKFAPFHKGHEYLIETGVNNTDEFYVVVYDTPELNIDIETKVNWIKSKFPKVKIIKAFDSPKKYGLDDESVNIQMDYLNKLIDGIEFSQFYSSEEYGKCVAKNLNIENVQVDPKREKYNIGARRIRENLEKEKIYLNDDVYSSIKSKKIFEKI